MPTKGGAERCDTASSTSHFADSPSDWKRLSRKSSGASGRHMQWRSLPLTWSRNLAAPRSQAAVLVQVAAPGHENAARTSYNDPPGFLLYPRNSTPIHAPGSQVGHQSYCPGVTQSDSLPMSAAHCLHVVPLGGEEGLTHFQSGCRTCKPL